MDVNKIFTLTLLIFLLYGCSSNQSFSLMKNSETVNLSTKTGLDVLVESELSSLYGKNIALVTNHSGIDRNGNSNISLLMENDPINLIKIFTPEHGFTGHIPAGEHIEHDTERSELPSIISLYGKTRKPTQQMLDNIDLIIYDIQDVGARFYTYISTLGLVMEAAAEASIPIMVLDRPNPIGNRVAGPLLNPENKSFVGKYPIPIQYGMTVGELAKMIVGEQLIDQTPELKIIPMLNYERSAFFDELSLPWVKPSPNIPNLETALIYPGFCLFEATNVSEGRGTYKPFKQFGAPWINSDNLIQLLNKQNLEGIEFQPVYFTPRCIPTMSKYPKLEDQKCYGIKLKITNRDSFDSILTGLTTLWAINKLYPDSLVINKSSLGRIWGTDDLLQQLLEDKTPQKILNICSPDLEQFKLIRKKYLLYN